MEGNITWQRTTLLGTLSGGQDVEVTTDYARNTFKNFIRHFQVDNIFIYRDQLRKHYGLSKFFINVCIEHLSAFDENLVQRLIEQPASVIPMVNLYIY